MTAISILPEALHQTHGTGASTNHHDAVALHLTAGALEVGLSSAGFNGGFIASDVYSAVFLGDSEYWEGVQCWGIFNVARLGAKASCSSGGQVRMVLFKTIVGNECRSVTGRRELTYLRAMGK